LRNATKKRFAGIAETKSLISNSESKQCAIIVQAKRTMTGATGCKKPQAQAIIITHTGGLKFMSKRTKKNTGTLTEFKVTETYYVKAITIDDAYEQVDNQNFKNGFDDYNLEIEPSY
jgi:hypothetical protein